MNLRYLNDTQLEDKGYSPEQIKDITDTIEQMKNQIYELKDEIQAMESAIVRNFLKVNEK